MFLQQDVTRAAAAPPAAPESNTAVTPAGGGRGAAAHSEGDPVTDSLTFRLHVSRDRDSACAPRSWDNVAAVYKVRAA
ncbi:hypothetical protein Q5P01_022240 [Channa striata]|uniref:Uncharacterized protein n=1 Tax=Channa striata TaxID=64152 RepID=A0AA88IS64_CHASR|nr:hypothetical protein Q5P01_022240 [Channa striata]